MPTNSKDLFFAAPLLLTVLIGVQLLVGATGRFWDTAQDLSYISAGTRLKYFVVVTAIIWLVSFLLFARTGGNNYPVPRVISGGAAGPNPEPAPLPQYKIHGHVNDFAGILNSEMRSELNQIGDELERKRKTQIAFVTVTWLNSVPLDDLASQLTKSWGSGGKNNDREILVLISLQERRSLIRVSPGLSWDLSPAEADRLGQEMAPMMEKGNYGEALVYTAGRIQQALQNEWK